MPSFEPRSRPAGVIALPLVLGGLLVLGSAPDVAGAEPESAADVEIDRRRLDYREHGEARANARVEAVLSRGEAGLRLRVSAAADGPGVEPPPGYRGVQGSNLISAEEIEALSQGGRLEVWTRRGDGQRERRDVRVLRWGRVAERRLLPDGTIDHEARSARIYPLEIGVDARLPAGATEESIWYVGGHPRLRVRVETDGEMGRIAALEGLDAPAASLDAAPPERQEPPPGPGLFTGLEPQAAPRAAAAERGPPVEPARWERLDAEARWLLLTRSLDGDPDGDPDEGKSWVAFLIDRREYTLLEWLALYRGRAFQTLQIGEALRDAGAPHWLRLGAWHIDAADTHSGSYGRELILSRPGLALDWLRRHPDHARRRLGDVLDALEKSRVAPGDASGQLPPLADGEVFAALDAPERVEDFGERERAEPGKVYLHQVQRALDGVAATGRREPAVLEKLERLTRHPDARVRQAAYLAYTALPARLIPAAASLAAADSADEAAPVREAALLAFSYSVRPDVDLVLLDAALARPGAGNPGWRAALSRLGDGGDGFVLRILEPVAAKSELDEEDRAFLSRQLDRIRRRLAEQPARSAGHIAPRVRELLLRAAWADVRCHPLEAELVRWTLDEIRPHVREPAVRTALEAIGREEAKSGSAGTDRSGASDDGGAWDLTSHRAKRYALALLESR
jgi:hypothetical protein